MKQRFAPTAAAPSDEQDEQTPSEAARLREIREWANRLHLANEMGYRLHDVSIGTVMSNTDFLLTIIDRRCPK